jgi:ribonucleoside-diphosphate reductase alpha chain
MVAQTVKMNEAQRYIQMSRYSRWRYDFSPPRREFWPETVERYVTFMKKHFETRVPKHVWPKVESHILNMKTMPSMRALWAAGDCLEDNNITGYNCCYIPFVDLRAVVELFYILMCGTGVGFSVEGQYISQMPTVKRQTGNGRGTHIVGDSREGWADALWAGLEAWFNGDDIDFDYSAVRGRGKRLKRMGGRASGPGPLIEMLKSVRQVALAAQGRRLTDLEWQDMGNLIADVVVVGGIRRASEIAFSDLFSVAIRDAKTGNFPVYRRNSNNSATYFNKPTMVEFMTEWAALAKSGTGERGIFNVSAIEHRLPKRREFISDLRCNPCGEILLRPFQFCNLSEVVIRAEDEFDDLVQKVEVAVWLGAMQSCLTKFPYIRDEFRKNCEEERLLGVSLSGQMDNPKLLTADRLSDLKKYAQKVAKRACDALGINFSAAVTTGKPSGTLSQLVNCASGMHGRHSAFQIRRYRNAATDPLYQMMRDQGVRWFPEVGQEGVPPEKVTTWVCEFPVAAPKGAVTRDQITAIEQLEWYLKMQKSWCEHNQSCTIYVRDDEWLKVGAWVYDHWYDVVGVAFLPYDGGVYRLAPNEEITEEEYKRRVKEFPVIDYTQLQKYEVDDTTQGAQTLACNGDKCEIA